MRFAYGFAVIRNDTFIAEVDGKFVWDRRRKAKQIRDFYNQGTVVRVKVSRVGKKRKCRKP